MSAPLIGITTYRQPHLQGFPLISIAEAYVQAVFQAGGIPVLIPLGIPDHQLQDLLTRLDGILFSGGGDIDPDRFGADPHPEVSFVDSDRDRIEIQLVLDAVQRGTPFLGICRGIQTVNVALGGTLYTHIPDQRPSGVHHPYIEGNPRDYLAHSVQVQPETRLFNILGQSSLQVNSMHHQGIERPAPGTLVTAHAPDGLIEAIELSDHRFGIAVQWHPEWLTGQAPMRALFRAFVEVTGL
jgi:putative glutamine amidotransferase